ncbi:class I SAM-dependent methyltransferase [Streptomyces beihaiensis]|uniref:Class I SAM-dependent methyltransferase n=1 Tax=Streptomyces beihaiensis TaxID=2984495 RepID=A0ABT3TZK0_9ACTN|nr:class I SAM-dependent methyltransferase [Streptomyces beihaiensis]MCX3061480.1 class I SAM-dependent methyltransferase [Streptomyces beihaiensis]
MANSYEDLSRYYDLIMTSGYYDYDVYARALVTELAGLEDVLELGVGTGLACERLLRAFDRDHDARPLARPAPRLTGIDHTEAMLAQARERLGDRVRLMRQDITEMTMPDAFDAAYSVGGVWTEVREETGIEVWSHLVEEEDDVQALKNVAEAVRPGGPLLIAVQQAHRSYDRPLPGGLVYAQELTAEPGEEGDGGKGGDRFIKDYYVRKDNGEVLAHQRSRYHVYPRQAAEDLLAKCGFRFDRVCGAGALIRYVRE